MIIENQADVTKAVLSELARAPDPRFREIMSAFIRHLHDFAREVKLTEQEFQTAAAFVNAIGKSTNKVTPAIMDLSLQEAVDASATTPPPSSSP